MTRADACRGPGFESCPLGCGGSPLPSDIRVKGRTFLECPSCGLLLSAWGADEIGEMNALFNTEEGTNPGPAERQRRFRRHRRLLRHAPRVGNLLDVGCSAGAFLESAARLGWEVCGVEPNPVPARRAASDGFAVHVGFLADARFPDASFDAVTLLEVLEHLCDPVPVFLEIRRLLRPGGVCIVTTGYRDSWTARFRGGEWPYFDSEAFGGHVCFYGKKAFARLAERAGLVLSSLSTRQVRLCEKRLMRGPRKWMCVTAQELLSLPARLLGRGQDATAVFRKPGSPAAPAGAA